MVCTVLNYSVFTVCVHELKSIKTNKKNYKFTIIHPAYSPTPTILSRVQDAEIYGGGPPLTRLSW